MWFSGRGGKEVSVEKQRRDERQTVKQVQKVEKEGEREREREGSRPDVYTSYR